MDNRTRILSDLNDAQIELVTSDSPRVLGLAGPGSGKTRSLTRRVAYLIDLGNPPHAIMLATLTNKAAEEMKTRISDLLGGMLPSDMWSGTFHATGTRFLRKYATLARRSSNFGILDESDRNELIKACLSEVQLKMDEDDVRFVGTKMIPSLISHIKNRMMNLETAMSEFFPDMIDYIDEIRSVIVAYENKKIKSNVFDFDDLLHYWYRIMVENPKIEESFGTRFRHILVDEYQDTNILQGEIIKRISKYTTLTVVGDDAQAIYSFNGADVRNILNFTKEYENVHVVRLEQNYRSTPEILEVANRCISHNKEQHPKKLFTNNPSGERPVCIETIDQHEEAIMVVSEIMRLYYDESVPLSQIAVLYRSSYMSNAIEMELMNKRIPYQVFGGIKFLEHAHIKDILAWLKIMNNPYDELAWRRVLLLQPGIGEKTVAKLWASLTQNNQNPLDAILNGFDPGLKNKASWNTIVSTLQTMKSAESITEMIDATLTPDYKALLKKKYPDKYHERIKGIERLSDYASRYRSLGSFLETMTLNKTEIVTGSEETNEDNPDTLTLSTIHSAKGKEWDVVFVIGLNEGSFPSDGDLSNIEEARRLFFVAVTRPRHRLILTRPTEAFLNGRVWITEPSQFLEEVRDLCVAKETSQATGLSWL